MADADPDAGTASVSYVCTDCGRVHHRRNPPCNECGSMDLAVSDGAEDRTTIDADESWQLVREADAGITGTKVFVYLVGALTALVGGLQAATGSPVTGVALLAAGVVAMPASRWRIERRLTGRLSPQATLVVYLGLCVGGSVLDLFV